MPSLKTEVKDILGMREMEESAKYLGLPTAWGKSKKEALGFIRDRIVAKIRGWGNKQLNQAGKEVLIKSVLQSITMYPFMCLKALASFCSLLNSVISRFWWGNGERGGIHWGAWAKLMDQKGLRGMGFKDFESFNIALLAHQFWRMIITQMPYGLKCLKVYTSQTSHV